MKSVFFRRLLIVMVMVMMLTTIAMALGCGVVGIKIYENITLEEMVPKAGTVADLVRELGYGHISREAFLLSHMWKHRILLLWYSVRTRK